MTAKRKTNKKETKQKVDKALIIEENIDFKINRKAVIISFALFLLIAGFFTFILNNDKINKKLSANLVKHKVYNESHEAAPSLNKETKIEPAETKEPEVSKDSLEKELIKELNSYSVNKLTLDNLIRGILNNYNSPVFAIKNNQKTIYISKDFEYSTGFRVNEVLSKHYTSFINNNDLAVLLDGLNTSEIKNKVSLGPIRLLKKNGEFTYNIVHVQFVRDGNNTYIIGFLHDFTEQVINNSKN